MFSLRRVIIRLINLRTINTFNLYSIIYVYFALGVPYALYCVSRRPGFLLSNSVRVLLPNWIIKNQGFYSRSVMRMGSLMQRYVYNSVKGIMYYDSWIKIDQLDVTCFILSLFTAQHVSNISTSIFRSLRLIVDLFHVLYCSGSMCIGVTVWLGWGGVVSLCRLRH